MAHLVTAENVMPKGQVVVTGRMCRLELSTVFVDVVVAANNILVLLCDSSLLLF